MDGWMKGWVDGWMDALSKPRACSLADVGTESATWMLSGDPQLRRHHPQLDHP